MSEIVAWTPQDGPQRFAIEHAYIEEMFYGGAVGGGKTDFLLGDFAMDVPQPWGPHVRGILFRKTYKQLQNIIDRSKIIFPQWFGIRVEDCYSEGKAMWTFPNGATLLFRHMSNKNDWINYWGHDYTWIGWDELPTWADPEPYLKLKTRLRSAYNVPYKRVRATGNPGGPGHQWIMSHWHIASHPRGGVVFEEKISDAIVDLIKDSGLGANEVIDLQPTRKMFVLSRLTDNKILMANDPQYISNLAGLGSETLVKAWVNGDWTVVTGAYFNEFDVGKHVIEPIPLPTHWTRFRAMDWGSAKPFAILWFAVSDGVPFLTNDKYGKKYWHTFPRGCLIVYREYYGMEPGKYNVGLKLPASEVGEEIARRERGETIDFGVADPSMFKVDGGPSNAETIGKQGVHFQRADNSRVTGWGQVRERLVGTDRVSGSNGKPMIIFFDTCINTIRTLPSLQHSDTNAEDLDSSQEDHAADALRYGCMARSWVKAAKPGSKPIDEKQLVRIAPIATADSLMKEAIRKHRNNQ